LIFATKISGTVAEALKIRRDEAAAVASNIDTDIHRAIGFLGAGKKARALACLRALDAGFETNAIRCNLAGLIYLSAEKNLLALEWFDRALALDPANLEALSNRGLALQELGRTVDALAAYEEAARAGCAKPAPFYNRGNLLRGAGHLTEAIVSYDIALRLDPAYPEALRAGGLVLSDTVALKYLGRFETALEGFDAALARWADQDRQ
jgi:tetratricopeptide (TPR) repeat protein